MGTILTATVWRGRGGCEGSWGGCRCRSSLRDEPVIICIILSQFTQHVQDSLRPLVFTFAFHQGLLPFQSDLLGSHHTPTHPITPQLRLCRSFPLLLVDGCHRVQAALGENRLGFVCAIICPRGFTALLVAFQPSSRDYLGSRAESSHRQPFVLLKDLFPPHMSVSDAVEAAPIYVSVLISSPAFQRCSYNYKPLYFFPIVARSEIIVVVVLPGRRSRRFRCSKPISNSCQHRLCKSGPPRRLASPLRDPDTGRTRVCPSHPRLFGGEVCRYRALAAQTAWQ